MSSPQIITGPRCKRCPKTVPLSIAHLFGNEAAGYICPECLVKEHAQIIEFGQSCDAVVDIFDAPSPCAMCGGSQYTEGRLVPIDGKIAIVCIDRIGGYPGGETCEQKWMRLNRDKLGPIAQYERKLR